MLKGRYFSGMGIARAALALALCAPLAAEAQTTTGTGGGYNNTSGYSNTAGYNNTTGYQGPSDINPDKTATGNGTSNNAGLNNGNSSSSNLNLTGNATGSGAGSVNSSVSTSGSASSGSSNSAGATTAGGSTGAATSSGSAISSGGANSTANTASGSVAGGAASSASSGAASGGTATGGTTNAGAAANSAGSAASGSGSSYSNTTGYNNTSGYQGGSGAYSNTSGYQGGSGAYSNTSGYNGSNSGYNNNSGYQGGEGSGTDYNGSGNSDLGASTSNRQVKAESAGQVFCNAFYNVGNIPNFISILAYLCGGAIFVRGAFDLIKRSSDPNKPLRDGLLGLMVGAFIVTLPWLVQFLHNSLFGVGSSSYSMPSCTATGGVDPSSPVPLDQMLMNFVNNIKGPIVSFISVMCVVLGAAMIFWNMVRLSKFGADAKSNTLTPIMSNLVIGAMLMAVGQTLDVSLATLFGEGVKQGGLTKYTTLAYVPGGNFDMARFDNAIKAVFDFLYIIGALSFVRGFMILKNAVDGQGQATKGQAFTHIIGGTLLVNMPGFIHIIEKTMGFKIIA